MIVSNSGAAIMFSSIFIINTSPSFFYEIGVMLVFFLGLLLVVTKKAVFSFVSLLLTMCIAIVIALEGNVATLDFLFLIALITFSAMAVVSSLKLIKLNAKHGST
jgi:hypothetical protein